MYISYTCISYDYYTHVYLISLPWYFAKFTILHCTVAAGILWCSIFHPFDPTILHLYWVLPFLALPFGFVSLSKVICWICVYEIWFSFFISVLTLKHPDHDLYFYSYNWFNVIFCHCSLLISDTRWFHLHVHV